MRGSISLNFSFCKGTMGRVGGIPDFFPMGKSRGKTGVFNVCKLNF